MRLHRCNRTVVVAVIAVEVMQVTADEVVRMVAVRHRGVTATRPVGVRLVVCAAPMRWRAGPWVRTADADPTLIDVIAMHLVQVAVMQVVDVPLVANGGVPAAAAVDVCMAVVRCVSHLDLPFWASCPSSVA